MDILLTNNIEVKADLETDFTAVEKTEDKEKTNRKKRNPEVDGDQREEEEPERTQNLLRWTRWQRIFLNPTLCQLL